MMREMKDHEMEQVVGGRCGGDAPAPAEKAPRFDSAKLTKKHITAPAKAALFLFPENQQFVHPVHNMPPKNLPGAQRKHTCKGGPFTFKTPYLNR